MSEDDAFMGLQEVADERRERDSVELAEVLEKLIAIVFKGGTRDRLHYAREAADALSREVPQMREACRLLASADIGYLPDQEHWAAYHRWMKAYSHGVNARAEESPCNCDARHGIIGYHEEVCAAVPKDAYSGALAALRVLQKWADDADQPALLEIHHALELAQRRAEPVRS